MRTFTVLSAVAALAARTADAQSSQPTINTPAALVVCQPAAIAFSGGTAPYFLSVLPAGQVSATPLESLPEQSAAGSYTWTVNLPAGTNITLSIRDSTGVVNYAAPVVIQSGTSTSCLNQTAASAASSAGVVGSASSTAASASIATSSASGTVVTTATSASVTVTAASGMPTPPASNMTGSSNSSSSSMGAYNFTCGAGQGDLTYGITIATLQNVTLSQVTRYFANWTGVAPGRLVNSSGTGVGAQRSYAVNNITISETLRLNQSNSSTGSLHQQWNFTQAASVMLAPNLTLYNAFEDLTIYTNTTTNLTSIQFFILGCFSNQQLGLTAIASLVEQSFAYWAGQISGSGSNSTSAASRFRRTVQLF